MRVIPIQTSTSYTVYVDYLTRIIFRFINVHATLISRIIHVYGIHVYSGKDLDAFNFAKTCHREIKVTLKLSTYTVLKLCIEQGYLPQEWRTHKIIPIFKSGDKSSVCNYLCCVAAFQKSLRELFMTRSINILYRIRGNCRWCNIFVEVLKQQN